MQRSISSARTLAPLALGAIMLSAGGSAWAAAGDLDPSFDADGKVTTDFSSEDRANDIAVQSDGKIVAVGETSNGDFSVVRYNTDGSVDASFDTDGSATTDFSGFDIASAVAIQPDGKIVVIGTTGGGDFAVGRYNADGSLDTSFDGDGKATADFSGFDQGRAVAVQPDGRIVTAGRAGNGDFALARYNADGSLDTSFDADGKLTTNFGGSETGRGVAIQPDGKIVVVGNRFSGGNNDFAVARYNPDGSLDASFDSDGKVTTDFGGFDGAEAVVIQSDGKIVAVGKSSVSFALARYNTDGSLDAGFDGDGLATTTFSDFAGATDAAIQSDGRILAVGFADFEFALVRYNTDGSPDASFDADGKVATDFGGEDAASGIAVQSDGKIVAAGVGGPESDTDFALARYLVEPDAPVSQPITPQEIIDTWERTPEPTANTLAGRDNWTANGDTLSYTDNAASAVISPTVKSDESEFRALFKAPNDNDLVGLVFGFQDIDNNYRLSFSGGGVRDYTFRGLTLVKEVGGVPAALFNDINIKWMPNTYYELIIGRDAAGDLYFEVIQAGLGAIAQGTVADNTFTSGKVGIYARSQRADFSQIVCLD